ncbi:putative TonB-dependent receptor [Azoarcus sp. CIB]|uniref:TonB-dependent receptor n=1 Tax=Aromatoleum sp. (strain CIB) TaxID=198107 RepID=UPI00067C1533|nr:TonB-dependent receptor [Azoarcus sp. CIB]AKU10317.1 putative TonB-dependent receptor [Azoarcus sp. CIB]
MNTRQNPALPLRRPVALSLLLAFGGLPFAAAAAETTELPTVTVSASALSLGSDAMSTPVSVLAGKELVLRRDATLGETLAREPGISASPFGAGASRPVIRGMDAARVKVLSDGAEIIDASTVSPDHAIASEPMLAEQIEVLRGPSALAYGGGAIGGVVNVLDRKIPMAIPARGVEGSVELRGNSAAREAAGAFELTAGSGNFAVHAEGLKRDARDYRVGDGWVGGRRVDGSFNETETGSLGLSWVGARGYLGLAYTHQRNDYGLPGHAHGIEECATDGNALVCPEHEEEEEEEGGVPVVKLDSERWDLRGEYLEPFAGFTRLRLRASHTDYRHHEVEEDTIATTFRNRAHDGRIELEHAPLAGWRGVLGLQTSRRDFRALGEEAYVPPTLTRKDGAFLVEEYTAGDWRFEAGLRREWQDIDVDAAARDRSHDGSSLSLGTVWNVVPGYALGLSLSRAQRLPTAEELYADGLHLATATFERGNADLKAETSHNIDLSLRKTAGDTTFSAAVYRNRVSDFIFARTLDALEGLQLVEYAQRDAVFTGVEGQIRQRLDAIFGVTLFGDYVRARFDGGAGDRDLPRIPAHRVGMRLDARWQGWDGELEWYRVGRQDQVAAFESSTPGYTMVNLAASYSGRFGAQPFQVYVKATNLGDELAFSHTSFIKNAAPLMGRNLTLGVRVPF